MIFLILDPQDEVYDRRLAGHLVSLYFRSHEEEEEQNLVSFLLKKQNVTTIIRLFIYLLQHLYSANILLQKRSMRLTSSENDKSITIIQIKNVFKTKQQSIRKQ